MRCGMRWEFRINVDGKPGSQVCVGLSGVFCEQAVGHHWYNCNEKFFGQEEGSRQAGSFCYGAYFKLSLWRLYEKMRERMRV
jgi:hypothetical protein